MEILEQYDGNKSGLLHVNRWDMGQIKSSTQTTASAHNLHTRLNLRQTTVSCPLNLHTVFVATDTMHISLPD